jgi:hypothetical protein
MMDDLAVWIIGWNEKGNEQLAERLRNWGGVPHVFTYTNYAEGESTNYNRCIRWSEENGFKYMMALDADVEVRYSETIPEMYKFLIITEKAGSIRPWRKGEEAQVSSYPPEEKYIEDGTALMWRINTGIYWSEELPYTGWQDLEFGCEMTYHGYKHYNDRRYPVYHNMAGSNAHSVSSILQAIKKRNKLIHDVKWYAVGRGNWQGVEAYNASVPLEKRIPTVNQLMCYSNEDQERFQQSISPEHHQIWVKDNHANPNLCWENPIVVGYSTRERFQQTHGYS